MISLTQIFANCIYLGRRFVALNTITNRPKRDYFSLEPDQTNFEGRHEYTLKLLRDKKWSPEDKLSFAKKCFDLDVEEARQGYFKYPEEYYSETTNEDDKRCFESKKHHFQHYDNLLFAKICVRILRDDYKHLDFAKHVLESNAWRVHDSFDEEKKENESDSYIAEFIEKVILEHVRLHNGTTEYEDKLNADICEFALSLCRNNNLSSENKRRLSLLILQNSDPSQEQKQILYQIFCNLKDGNSPGKPGALGVNLG